MRGEPGQGFPKVDLVIFVSCTGTTGVPLGVDEMAGEMTLRWVRASLLAAVAVLSALAGHVAAGGSSPSVPIVLALLVLASVVVAPVLSEPLSTGRVAALLVGGQGLLHLVLQWLGPVASESRAGGGMPDAAAMTDTMTTPMMTGSAMVYGHSVTAGSSFAVMSGSHFVMMAGHLAAAVVVGVWLAAGERAVWTVVALAGGSVVEVVLVLLRRVSSHLHALHLEPAGVKLSQGWFWLQPLGASGPDRHSVRRRGPPASLTV